MAQREHDAKLTVAKQDLYTAVLVGCHAAGAGTFIAFNAGGWWVNLVPGIGTAAIEALSTLGGLVVDISCLVRSVNVFNAETATVENRLPQDMVACEQSYTDCH